MSLYATINEEVQSVLRENEQKKVIGALSQILSDPSTQIPKLEKFVKTNLPQLIAAFKEAPIQKEVRDDEDTIPFGEAPDDDVEARVRDARNKAVGTAKAAVKGAVGDVAVASSRTMATVISRLPGGKRWLAPLLGAIFDPTTNKAAKNFAIFAIANLLAGPEINPLLSADLGDVLQSIGGVDWDRLNVVDDVVLLSVAKKGLKDSGTDLNKATKRFLAFAQGKENPEKADAARKERNAAFQAKIDKAREKNNPKSPEDAWASDFDANLNKDKGPKYDTPVVPRRRVKGPVPTDAPMFQATTGKRRKRKEESVMKKSELMKIIREEVEVVLTNEEAVEIFNLDPAALIDEMLKEEDLSAAERRALPDSDFALPGKGEGPEGKQSGSYPIPDAEHARMALAMVAKHGTAEEKAKVRAAVKKKFPDIDQGKD